MRKKTKTQADRLFVSVWCQHPFFVLDFVASFFIAKSIFFGEFNSNVWLCLRIIQWCVSWPFIHRWIACKLLARKISYSLKMLRLESVTMCALWHIHFRQIHKNKRQNGTKTEEIRCRTKCFMYFVEIPTIPLFIFQQKKRFLWIESRRQQQNLSFWSSKLSMQIRTGMLQRHFPNEQHSDCIQVKLLWKKVAQ